MRIDMPFNNRDIQLPADIHYNLTGNAWENMSKRWCKQSAILLHKEICSWRRTNVSIHIQQQCFVIASYLGFTGSKNSVYVMATDLCFNFYGSRIWSLIGRYTELQQIIAMIFSPFPRTHHKVNIICCGKLHVRTAVGERANVGIGEIVLFQKLIRRLYQFIGV